MKQFIISTAALFCSLAAFSAPIEWWSMNDVAGTDLNDLSNSGTLGSEWNFNTAGHETDGSGLFVVSGDAAVGTTTRKLPKKGTANAELEADVYASPITAGAYSLVVDFDSWSFDAASEGDAWKVKAQDSSGVDIAGIEMGVNAGQGRMRMWTMGASNSYFRTFNFNLVEAAGATAEVRFDFDNDTVAYYVDGAEEYSFSDFSGTEFAGMVYTTSGDGTADWATPASSLSIDAMGVDVIPEPAVLGLISVAGLMLFLSRKRNS